MLPVAGASIDLVFSSLTYQWCDDPGRAFAEARRILKPNGLFLFATLGPDTLKELRASWAAVDDYVHVNTFFDMHDIGDTLVRAGMEDVVMDVEVITMHYGDCKGLMGDIKAVGAHNVNVARRRGLTGKDKFRRMLQAYEQYRSGEGLPATYEIVYGHAWTPAQERVGQRHGQTVYIPVSKVRRYKDRA
jgi:malonyl-CoA O-methyltransferase